MINPYFERLDKDFKNNMPPNRIGGSFTISLCSLEGALIAIPLNTTDYHSLIPDLCHPCERTFSLPQRFAELDFLTPKEIQVGLDLSHAANADSLGIAFSQDLLACC